MSGRLRVGIVGLGIGRQHVAGFAQLPEQWEVAAVCDVDAERLGAAAEAVSVSMGGGGDGDGNGGGVERFDSFETMLSEASLDVVDLCTPPHLHFAQARAALESGHHVICEKPLVPGLAEVDEIEAIAQRCERVLMPIFQYRYGAGFQKLLRLIELGIAGPAYLSTVETAWRRGASYYAAEWRGRWKTELGGVLLTHAIHAHDLLCCAVGPVRSVFARTNTRVNPVETEDCAAISLEMADGSLATLSATLGSSAEISRLRFCFQNLTAESALAPYTPSFDPWTFTGASADHQARIDEALRGFEAGPQWYPGQFADFHATLEAGEPPPVTLADARAALELVTAMYHSSATGEAVVLPLAHDHPRYRSWLPEAAR